MLEDDIVLLEQLASGPALSPEQRLCWGLLEDVLSLKRRALREPHNHRLQQQLSRDRDWLDGADALLPFETVCQAIGLEPDVVRRAYFSPKKNDQDEARTATKKAKAAGGDHTDAADSYRSRCLHLVRALWLCSKLIRNLL